MLRVHAIWTIKNPEYRNVHVSLLDWAGQTSALRALIFCFVITLGSIIWRAKGWRQGKRLKGAYNHYVLYLMRPTVPYLLVEVDMYIWFTIDQYSKSKTRKCDNLSINATFLHGVLGMTGKLGNCRGKAVDQRRFKQTPSFLLHLPAETHCHFASEKQRVNFSKLWVPFRCWKGYVWACFKSSRLKSASRAEVVLWQQFCAPVCWE